MVKNELKKVMVFSDLKTKQLVEARINAIAEIRKTSASKVYEGEFSKLFIPENPVLRQYAELIFLRDDGIKEALKTFLDENRSTEKPLKYPKYGKIVRYIYEQAVNIRTTDFEYKPALFEPFRDVIYYLVNVMQKKTNSVDRIDAISIEREIEYVKSLFSQIEQDIKSVKPSLFLGWLLHNWSLISDNPYVIDALNLLLEFQKSYRESGAMKEKLLAILTEIVDEDDS